MIVNRGSVLSHGLGFQPQLSLSQCFSLISKRYACPSTSMAPWVHGYGQARPYPSRSLTFPADMPLSLHVNLVCCRFLLPVSCCCLSRALSQRFRVNWKRTTKAEPEFVDRPCALLTSFPRFWFFIFSFFFWFFFYFTPSLLFLVQFYFCCCCCMRRRFPSLFLAKLELCNAVLLGREKATFIIPPVQARPGPAKGV